MGTVGEMGRFPGGTRGLWLIAAAIVVAAWVASAPYVTSAALLARAAPLTGPVVDLLAAWRAHPVSSSDVHVATRSGDIAARVYRPRVPGTRVGRTVVVAAGVNPRGLDEPRLDRLARAIASAGFGVITPELPDLVDFRLTPRLPDQIEDVALWASGQRDLAPDGRVGLLGISFSGGLSIVAAGRPAVAERVAYVVSLGGYGDLARTARALSTGRLPDGTPHPAHDYGVAVLLYNVAGGLVPGDQIDPLRAGVRTFLEASTVYMTDEARGLELAEQARQLEPTLAEPARTLLHYVTTRNTGALSPLLVPELGALTSPSALSPERSTPPRAPVFLLHGKDDTVIPASETTALAAWLAARGVRVRVLVTPLVAHAQVHPSPRAADVWRLIRFWADVVSR
jgi:dienelactone hydrolase